MTIGAFLIGIPVYMRQRNRMTDPGEVAAYRE
jgi:hypothetical protein